MITGQQTTADVSTGIKITDIEGHKTTRWMWYNRSNEAPFGIDGYMGDSDETWLGHSNYTRIHNLTLSITPRSGSADIDLSQVIIEISNSSAKCVLTYSSSEFASSVLSTGVFTTAAFDLRPDQFGVIEIEDADDSCDSTTPVINRGDRIMLTINASACFFGLEERADVWGTIYPEEGASAMFDFRIPSVLSDTVFDMYIRD